MLLVICLVGMLLCARKTSQISQLYVFLISQLYVVNHQAFLVHVKVFYCYHLLTKTQRFPSMSLIQNCDVDVWIGTSHTGSPQSSVETQNARLICNMINMRTLAQTSIVSKVSHNLATKLSESWVGYCQRWISTCPDIDWYLKLLWCYIGMRTKQWVLKWPRCCDKSAILLNAY